MLQYAGREACLWYSMAEERPAYGAACRKRGLPMVEYAGREACLWYSMLEERPAYGTACQPACYSVEYDVLQTTELLYHQGVSTVQPGPTILLQ